jgi:hypothetical protein
MDEIPMFPNVDLLEASIELSYRRVFYPVVLHFSYQGFAFIRGNLMSLN